MENGKKLAIMGDNSVNHRYTCVVANKVGTITKDFTVKVSFNYVTAFNNYKKYNTT